MTSTRFLPVLAACWIASASAVHACELCAIYSADNARAGGQTGWVLTLSESYVPYDTVLLNNKEVTGPHMDYRDTSMTHLVPGYNVTRWLGVNLSVPLVYQNFRRTEARYSLTPPSPVIRTEQGQTFDLGDISLIARVTAFEKTEMEYSLAVTLLAGVKFPTGNTDRIEDEVSQAQIFESFLPPGQPHDPLGHAISGVHEHDLSPGSGSYDGVFGATFRSRWQRWFLNAQFQYYLRTEGAATFHYGDEIMVSGGPGGYVLLGKRYTLNLQANTGYDTMTRDELLGRLSNRTGFTAWYLGPQIGFTYGQHFSAVTGVDIPLHITANGLQNVPSYRFHASLGWRF